jgi:hypothetical protein
MTADTRIFLLSVFPGTLLSVTMQTALPFDRGKDQNFSEKPEIGAFHDLQCLAKKHGRV